MTSPMSEMHPTWEETVEAALDVQCVMARYLRQIDEDDAGWELLGEVFPQVVAIVERLEAFGHDRDPPV